MEVYQIHTNKGSDSYGFDNPKPITMYSFSRVFGYTTLGLQVVPCGHSQRNSDGSPKKKSHLHIDSGIVRVNIVGIQSSISAALLQEATRASAPGIFNGLFGSDGDPHEEPGICMSTEHMMALVMVLCEAEQITENILFASERVAQEFSLTKDSFPEDEWVYFMAILSVPRGAAAGFKDAHGLLPKKSKTNWVLTHCNEFEELGFSSFLEAIRALDDADPSYRHPESNWALMKPSDFVALK